MKKKILFLSLIILMGLTLTGCSINSSSDEEIANQTEKQMKEINREVGMPAIKNFQEKKLAKQIFELRDREDLITYVYLFNQMSGKLVFIGKAIGFGLPYSVQYTNPMKARCDSYCDSSLLPQADPNGLYMPTGLSATWVMLLDKNGKPHPVYVEQEILVSPFPLNNKLIQK